MGRFLGMGIAGLATGLAPEVIVIIGDVTAAWDRVGPAGPRRISAPIAAAPTTRGSCPPIGRRSRVSGEP